ncbi:VWA domain-containing protein [Methanobacterium oryzae]|uniref:VWA domain-containing protein n=1 Tax=Methanobacterium oryzae TaxID=69540 RepID=UPI003D1C2F4A
MINEIVKFSGVLRENGIPASIRSTQLACEATPLIEKEKGNLKEALAAIYLKDQRQRKKFNEIFESFFDKKEVASNPKSDFGVKPKFIKKYNVSISTKRVSDFDSGDKGQQYKIDYIKNTLNDISDNGDREGNSELLKSDIKTLNTLQPELIDLCQKLGRKIATKRVRRYKQAKKRKPDIRRSIRKNMKHGGTLLELVKSKPKIKKQNHYFLSDVSVSCDWISIWFFCMVYAAQNSFNRARAFEFDNKTAEITSALFEPDLVDAFIKVLEIRQNNSMIRGKSNMFTAFEGFLKQANLNSKSYVMILSDCRDWAGPKEDKIPKSAELIENMVKKSKRVLILNPEEKKKWNAADSCVSYYENAGAEVFEVGNLDQLADLISEI